MSTFSSLPTPATIGERIDIATDINGEGIRITVCDPEWSTAPGDGCTLISPDDARAIAHILLRAADTVADVAAIECEKRDHATNDEATPA